MRGLTEIKTLQARLSGSVICLSGAMGVLGVEYQAIARCGLRMVERCFGLIHVREKDFMVSLVEHPAVFGHTLLQCERARMGSDG
ncbi:MAG: hypothetical protein R3B54_07510 [Bdellovibrionota bacterium]